MKNVICRLFCYKYIQRLFVGKCLGLQNLGLVLGSFVFQVFSGFCLNDCFILRLFKYVKIVDSRVVYLFNDYLNYIIGIYYKNKGKGELLEN